MVLTASMSFAIKNPQRIPGHSYKLNLKGFPAIMNHDHSTHIPFHQSLIRAAFHENNRIQFLYHGIIR